MGIRWSSEAEAEPKPESQRPGRLERIRLVLSRVNHWLKEAEESGREKAADPTSEDTSHKV